MKKISLLIGMIFFLSVSIAQATMNEYKKPGFDFTTIKNILVLETKEDTRKSKITNDFAFRHVDGELSEALAEAGLRVTYLDAAIKIFNIGNERPYDVLRRELGKEKADEIFFAWAITHYEAYLTPTIVHYKNTRHRQPGYVTTRREIERVKVYEYRDRDRYHRGGYSGRDGGGRYTIIEVPRTVYINIPDRYYQTSDICVNFILYSMSNHAEIFLLRDERSREGDSSFDGMTKRICANLANKLSDNMPNIKFK